MNLMLLILLVHDNLAFVVVHPDKFQSGVRNHHFRSSFTSSRDFGVFATKDDDSEEIDIESNIDPAHLKWIEKRSELPPVPYDESEGEELSGNVNIPKTGVSVNDEITDLQMKEKFVSKLFPLEKTGIAAIQTATVDTISDEPMRYLVPLKVIEGSTVQIDDAGESHKHDTHHECEYAMIDVPPFSEELANQIITFTSNNDGRMTHILCTSKNGLHYNESPAVYVSRKSDLLLWKKAFPDLHITMYRLDTPRDCRDVVTQRLDGYGPWAMESTNINDSNNENMKFIETGRPLTKMEWDEGTQIRVLDNGESPPDDDVNDTHPDDADDSSFTPVAIKKREENKDILAIYTPGHTFGSVTYIFPHTKVCCSGFTFPVEDTRPGASSTGMPNGAGPKLDFSGYLSTNEGSIERQIESGRHIANIYSDRFEIVLPSRGPPINLGPYNINERCRMLHGILTEFEQLGKVYSQMGLL